MIETCYYLIESYEDLIESYADLIDFASSYPALTANYTGSVGVSTEFCSTVCPVLSLVQ